MRAFAALAIALTIPGASIAQQETFVVNPQASEVKMTLITTHDTVHGTFHVQAGTIRFDDGSPAMSGEVIVVAGSGKTGNDTRDRKMNKEILNVERYAAVSFQPKSYAGKIAPTGDSAIQMSGIFTLLGTPHDITVPVVIHREGQLTTGKAHLVIPYVKWGLKNPSFLIWKADEDVTIDLNLAGNLTP